MGRHCPWGLSATRITGYIMLEITGLSKTYPTGTIALKEISFTVDEPQVVTIIGPSGAGKSTLIRCINRLVEPTSGKIMLDGIDVTALNRRELRKVRRRMGMIFQEYNLVERLTVMENSTQRCGSRLRTP
jgi:phosphonate transport system ATP-binding protein